MDVVDRFDDLAEYHPNLLLINHLLLLYPREQVASLQILLDEEYVGLCLYDVV